MRRHVLVPIAVIAVLALSLQALAHHAFSAEFDANKPVKLRGNVVKMDWINPHAWLHVDVKSPDGKIVSWMIELGPPQHAAGVLRPDARERPRCDVPGWTEDVRGILEYRRAGRERGEVG